MFELCPPALIYLIFSLTQIIIDLFKGLYNTAFFKFIVMIMITLLLNMLCQGGLSIIAWFIVFIPFILMTVIVTMLLYVFGLDIATGKINTQPTTTSTTTSTTTKNIVVPQSSVTVFNPNYSPITNPAIPITNPAIPNTYPVYYPANTYPPPPPPPPPPNALVTNQPQLQPAFKATYFPKSYTSSPEYSS
jgi:hypothetical protein